MIFATLTAQLPPSFTGVIVGAITGALAFVSVVAFARARRTPKRLVVVPPYRALTPEAVFAVTVPAPVSFGQAPEVDVEALQTRTFRRPRNAGPQLSAHALARMGIGVGPFGQKLPASLVGAEDDSIDVDFDAPDAAQPAVPAVTVMPIIIISDEVRLAADRAPSALAVIKKSSGIALRSPAAAPESTPAIDDMIAGALACASAAARPKIRRRMPEPARFAAS
jgi:hypothetical protein